MSSITIHTRHAGGVRVHGRERAYGRQEAIRSAMRVLGADTETGAVRLVRQGILPREALAFTAFGENASNAVSGWLGDMIGESEVRIGDEAVPTMHAVLNTAAVEGPDAVAFLARLHGSVEDRIWVDAADVKWFAALLEKGLGIGILRPGMGWENAIDHVVSADGPVVISSSQGREFPDVTYDEDLDEPLLPEDSDLAWSESLSRLQQQGWWLQLTPGNLRKPAYSPLRTLHELLGQSR